MGILNFDHEIVGLGGAASGRSIRSLVARFMRVRWKKGFLWQWWWKVSKISASLLEEDKWLLLVYRPTQRVQMFFLEIFVFGRGFLGFCIA